MVHQTIFRVRIWAGYEISINYAVLGVVNRRGHSKSMISCSVRGPCLALRSKKESGEGGCVVFFLDIY